MAKSQSQSSSNLNSNRFKTDFLKTESHKKENRKTLNKHSPEAKVYVPTIPEPFEMTIREDNKRKERLLAIQTGLLANTNGQDEKSTTANEHFRAIEMPSHVLEKRYEKIIKKQEMKRKKAKEEAQLETQKKIKPFRFAEREEQKKYLKRSDSVPNLKMNCTKDFQANPFPEHLFTDFAYEQQKERENYREIQKKLRQEMLLKNSNFPPRMAADFKKKLHENKGLSKQNQNIPKKVRRGKTDLDRLYREYKENLERKNFEKEMFVGYEKTKVNEKRKERKRPQSADSGKKHFFPASFDRKYEYDDMEKSYNLATLLRLKLLEEKKQLNESAKVKHEKEERAREERFRMRRMNNPVWDNMHTGADRENLQEMTKRRLEEEKIRMENYKIELEKMMRRVESQPTLFQKQSQVRVFFQNLTMIFKCLILYLQACAKKSIEKKFNEILQKQGIDSKEIDNIWKMFPKTSDNRRRIGLDDGLSDSENSDGYEPPDVIHEVHDGDNKDEFEDYSEHDLAESISLNLSPVKEYY